MTIYASVDNGLNGGIVALNNEGNILSNPGYNPKENLFDNDKCEYIWLMPIIKGKGTNMYDIKRIVQIFQYLKTEAYLNNEKLIVMLEKAHIMPKNGGKQNFSTGEGFGMMKGILTALGISYEIVAAKEWQKNIFQGQTVTDTKQSSIMFCKNKYPNIDWRATEKCKKDHDGKTDACCLALYGMRLNKGK